MANLKASKKDILVNKRNYDRNRNLKTALKSAIKVASAAIESFGDDTKALVFSARVPPKDLYRASYPYTARNLHVCKP